MPGPTHISKLLEQPDPLFQFNWYMSYIPNFGTDMRDTYVEKVDVPIESLAVKDDLYGGARYTYYPGFITLDEVSITFYEDHKGTTLGWIQTWKNKIIDLAGNYSLPNEYKKWFQLIMLDTTGQVAGFVMCIGVWPTSTGGVSLSSDNGRVTIQQNFKCDRSFYGVLG